MKKTIIVFLALSMALLSAQGQKKDIDWKEKCETKVAECDGVVEILGPVVEYLTEAFEKHKFTETTTEDWNDAVAQFTFGNKYYNQGKGWMEKGKYNKITFLKLEEAWQYYVKTGVAGIRTKAMVDHEIGKK